MNSDAETLGITPLAASLARLEHERADERRAWALVSLALMVGVSTLIQAAIASRMTSPSIIPDELIYSEFAKSLASGNLPGIRGEFSLAYGLGYPMLLSPLWAIFDDVEEAYASAKVVNAFVLSLTAVPAYYLARRFVLRTSALLVSGLTIAVPSMLYAGTLLTEVALYPAFVLALLAIAAAMERPTTRAQALALGAIVLAASVKMLAVVLVLTYVASVLLFHWLDARNSREWRARLGRYRLTWLVIGTCVMAGIAFSFVGSRKPADVLGAYAIVIDNIDPQAVPWWFAVHLAELDLYLAVIPFVAAMLVVCRGLQAHAEPHVRLYTALVLPVVGGMVAVVAAYSSKAHAGAVGYFASEARIHERSTFILAPLLFTGLALWLRDRQGLSRVAVGAIAVAVLMPTLIPVRDLDPNVRFQALALTPWFEHGSAETWLVWSLVLTAALGLFFVLAAHLRAPGLAVLPVVMVLVCVTLFAASSMRSAAAGARSGMGDRATWVDEAVGAGKEVSVLWAERPGEPFVRVRRRHYPLFIGEFFNRSVGSVYELGSPLPYALPTTPVRIDSGRVVLEDGAPARLGQLVLAPCWVHVEGSEVARDASTGAAIYRVPAQVRVRVSAPETCA